MVPKRRDTRHGRSDGLYTDRQKGKKPDCEGVRAPFFCVLTVLCLKRKDNEIQQNNKEKQQNRKTTNEQDKRNKRKEKLYSSIHVYIYIYLTASGKVFAPPGGCSLSYHTKTKKNHNKTKGNKGKNKGYFFRSCQKAWENLRFPTRGDTGYPRAFIPFFNKKKGKKSAK